MPDICQQKVFLVRSTPYTGEECARGVFAVQQIRHSTLVEVAHCIKLTPQEYQDHGRSVCLYWPAQQALCMDTTSWQLLVGDLLGYDRLQHLVGTQL